jgi:hypothetical protein
MGKSLINSMSFKILIMVLNTKKLPTVCFIYFKYSWKTPGKRMKKVLENPGFFKL